MGRRRQAREAALQALYLAEAGSMSAQEAMLSVKVGLEMPADALAFAEELAYGADEQREELDACIHKLAQNWALERMAAVDRNLLRLASFELLTHEGTPASVIIDEALEIAKIFSADDSAKFINGILDKIRSSKKKTKKKKTKKKAKKLSD
jgi:N utilization substance protein B